MSEAKKKATRIGFVVKKGAQNNKPSNEPKPEGNK